MNKRDYGFYEGYILNNHKRAIESVKANLDSLRKEQSQEVKPRESTFVSQYGDNPFVGLNNDVSNGQSQGMGSEVRQLSRIRTMDGSSVVKPFTEEVASAPTSYENIGSYGDYSYTQSNKGSSFVLVLAAVIALVIIVAVVSFSIISKIGL